MVSTIALTLASSTTDLAALENVRRAAVPEPVKYGKRSAALVRPASAASSASATVVALPTLVIGPVRFALVVTVAALPLMLV